MKRHSHLLSIFFLFFIFNNTACTPTSVGTDPTPSSTPTLISILTPTPDENTLTPTIAPTFTVTPTPTVTPTFIPVPTPNIKIMIMARQHGNEPAGTSAVFSYISDLVNDSSKYLFTKSDTLDSSEVTDEINNIANITSANLDIQISTIGYSYDNKALYCIKIQRPAGQSFDNNNILPSGVTLLFIPMVNPDGSDLNTRDNHDLSTKDDDSHWGANINRHWDDLRELENQAVHNNVFDVYNPEVVLDIHEFTAYDGREDVDFTYFRGVGDDTPTELAQFSTDFEGIADPNLTALLGSKFQKMATEIVPTWEKNNSAFGGNHFELDHYAVNYTIESKGMPSGTNYVPPLSLRVTMQRTFFQSMILYASTNKDIIINTISTLRANY